MKKRKESLSLDERDYYHIVREVFEDEKLPDTVCSFLLWEKTGWPVFFTTDKTVEEHIKEQLQQYKEQIDRVKSEFKRLGKIISPVNDLHNLKVGDLIILRLLGGSLGVILDKDEKGLVVGVMTRVDGDYVYDLRTIEYERLNPVFVTKVNFS